MTELRRELGWSARAHRAAVDAAMLAILVTALRCTEAPCGRVVAGGRHAAVVARLREQINERFRMREPVRAYAGRLGISETALRVACARVAASSPVAMLDERALLEAKRLLIFSHLSVPEIAYALGFDDPAYFSRFFMRHVGHAPSAFRAQRSFGTERSASEAAL